MKKRKMSFVRLIILLGLVAIVALAAKSYFSPSEKAPNYITAPAARGDIEKAVLADGTIKARRQVSVGAQVSGQIKKIHVELGQSIKVGQLIAEIDDLPQQNSLKQAEASLKAAQAQRASKQATLKNNQVSFERQQKLLNAKAGSKSDYDTAKATLDATKADLQALDAEIVRSQIAVDTAKLNLSYTKIVSPLDGVVVAMPVEEGQTVNAVQSTPTIIKVAQLGVMTVEAQISEADVINVKAGMPVYFTILGDASKRFNAQLRAVEPAPTSINNETSASSSSTASTAVYYNGLFDVNNPNNVLRISMTAQVYIVLAQSKNALVVPAMALKQIDQNGQNAVVNVLTDAGQVVEKPVKVGINNNISAEILSGLDEGEKVITSDVGKGASSGGDKQRMKVRMRL